MESSSREISEAGSRRPRGHRAGSRRPFVVRKRLDRQLARGRIATRTRRPLAPAQLAFDPLARPNRTPARRRARFLVAIFASLVAHVSAVGVGFVWRSQINGPLREEVRIEVRQRAPEPPPEKKLPPPPPVEKPTRTPPKIAKAPPPQLPTPPIDVPKPVRVIGLNLESTTEGGSGPAFAVGNTRLGETAKRAVAPKDITAAPSEFPAPPGPPGPARSNQVAGHIPIAGVKYEKPQRLHPKSPPFPPTLKAQGIEGDVQVVIEIDPTGKVTSVKIVKESPYPEFNEAARAAALAETYDPATKDGVPMSYSLPFTYRFRLEDE